MAYRIPIQQPKITMPSMGGGNTLQNALMLALLKQSMSQQQQQQAMGEAGPGAITKVTGDKPTFETEAGMQMAARENAMKKSAESAMKLKNLLPVVQQFKRRYQEVFSQYKVNPESRQDVLNKVYMGAFTGSDPKAASLLAHMEGMKAQLARGLGDVGNLNIVEQENAIRNLPKIGLQDLKFGVLPDNYLTGMDKFDEFEKFILTRLQMTQEQMRTGQIMGPPPETISNPMQGFAQQNQSDPLGAFQNE